MIRDRTMLLASLVLTASLAWVTARWTTTIGSNSVSRPESARAAIGESPDQNGRWRPRSSPSGVEGPLAFFDQPEPTTIGTALIDGDWAPELAGATIHADAFLVPDAPTPVAPGAEHAVPGALPNSPHAIPIDQRSPPVDPDLEALLARELGELSEAERNIWRDVLRELPVQQAEEILQIWKLTGSASKQFPPELTMPQPVGPRHAPGVPPTNGSAAQIIAPAERAALARILRQNIEHINTPGYRRREPDTFHSAADHSDTDVHANSGDAPPAGRLDLTRGKIRTTSNPLDVAIDGVGFFILRRDEQLVCTRCGRFDLTAGGQLVQLRADGVWQVDPPITVPAGSRSILIESSGRVLAVTGEGTDEPQECGRLELATFLNPQHLQTVSDDLLRPTAASGPMHRVRPEGIHGSLFQGALEASNATLASEAAILEQLERQAELLQRADRLAEPVVTR